MACPCVLTKLAESLVVHFAVTSADQLKSSSSALASELKAHDHWMALHAARCAECAAAYKHAAHKLAELLEGKAVHVIQ